MFPINQIRIARHTQNLKNLLRFYEEGLQFTRIGSFSDHDGYTGVMLGMPDAHVHLEFTEHIVAQQMQLPSPDDLLVFYFKTAELRDECAQRMYAMGFPEVLPENPYWLKNGITLEDPDGWRIVLVNTPSFSIDS
jgi:hypothetical protein